MASPALALASGAGQGLEDILTRITEQQKMDQVKQQLAETVRSHTAQEGIEQNRIDAQTKESAARLAMAQRGQDTSDARATRDDGRALGEEIPGDTRIPESDPAVPQMRAAGLGGILKGLKSHPAIPTGPIQAGDTADTLPVDSIIKGFTSNQTEKKAADDRATVAEAEHTRHDLAEENKPIREPNPQPQIFYGADNKPHAIQFVNGKSNEIPLDPALVGKKDPNDPKTAQMRSTGHQAVSRLDADIDKADSMGLIGPAAGRIYDQFAKFGTTGDPSKDEMIGRLKSDILLTKMHVDAGIGGTRAAASPLLLKNWEDIAMKSSKDLLHGYTGAIRDDMGPVGGASAAAAPAADPKIKRYDLKGNLLPPPQ